MPAIQWNEILPLLWMRIQEEPWVAGASAGLVVSTGYLLLMLVTRLGDIRPGIQSLVLSAVLHLVLMTFWGAMVLGTGVPKGPAEEPVRTRRIVIQPRDLPPAAKSGNVPVWERIPELPSEKVARTETAMPEPTPLDTPDRVAQEIEKPRAEPTEMARLPELSVQNPTAFRPTERAVASVTAAEQQLEIAEETEAARAEAMSSAQPLRQSQQRPERTENNVERQVRKGTEVAPRINVESRPQLTAITDLPDPAATIRRNTTSEVQRRTGPAAADIPLDDPGTADGAPSPASAGGTSVASKFTRSQRSPLSGTREGVPERAMSGAAPAAQSSEAGTLVAARSTSRDLPTGIPRPSVRRPELAAIAGKTSADVPATYRLRNLPQRQKLAISLGATEDSERAVEMSLKWLALHQSPEGNWDADGYMKYCPEGNQCQGAAGQMVGKSEDGADRQQAGLDADTGLTALVVLAFLGAGYTHEEGQYSDQVDRAIRWLIRQQSEDGFLGGKATRYDRMYCHGMATYALGEACGMASDPVSDSQLRDALGRAVDYIISNQNPSDGGWRYLPGQKGDMSMFGWQLMGLKSAEIAGAEIPQDTRDRMILFLKGAELGERGGLAAYRKGEKVKPSMTAEALFSRQMLGMLRTNAKSREAIDYLLQHPPKLSEQDLYYWYYGTLAMYQYGGEPWRQWNQQLRDVLVSSQSKTGHSAGSWDPRDPWGRYGGRLYSTALSTLCLEVYYRFLPLYQMGGDRADALEQ